VLGRGRVPNVTAMVMELLSRARAMVAVRTAQAHCGNEISVLLLSIVVTFVIGCLFYSSLVLVGVRSSGREKREKRGERRSSAFPGLDESFLRNRVLRLVLNLRIFKDV